MIKYLTILFLIACNTKPLIFSRPHPVVPPVNYVLKWVTIGNEPGVKYYKIQQSNNSRNWSTLTTVMPNYLPDSNVYNYTPQQPRTNKYYRVISVMVKGSYTSDPLYLRIP